MLLTRYDKANRPIETLLTQQSITESQMRGYFSYETVQTYLAQNQGSPFTSPVYDLPDNISLTKTEIGKTKLSFDIPDPSSGSGNNGQNLTLAFKPEAQTASQTDVDTTKFASVLWERTAMTMSKDGELIGIAENTGDGGNGQNTPATISQDDILYRYTAYFYDCYARPVQTVTLYPDGTVFTASTKYNYTGLPVRQAARLAVPQGAEAGSGTTDADTLNVLLTETFTYDKRGRMLTSNAYLQTFSSFADNNGNGSGISYSDTLSSSASATYSYDELGHLTGKTLGGNLTQTLAYNIQDWMTTMQTKKGTANIFSQTLRYYNPAKNNTTALYSGNISEWETVQGTNTASTYGFTYDTQGRLTSSDRYNGAATARNGNILTLKRISNFTYSYDGDKLSSLTRWVGDVAMNTPYSYDGNGNMTFDGDQQMKLCYDINNLLHDVKKVINTQSSEQEDLTAVYSYFADGTKYSIKDTDGNSRIYIGPFTLTRKDYGQSSSGNGSGNSRGNNSNSSNTTTPYITLLESADALGSDARFAFTTTPQAASGDTTYTIAYETLYLLKDHLGSIRTITDSQGNILEKNDYYPYGLRTDLGRNYPTLPDKYRMRMPTYFTAFGQNGNACPTVSSPTGKMLPYRLLYNRKELQMMAQTRLVDYGARMLDPVIARWNGMDPMAESYYLISNYSYCDSNPLLYIDLNGLDIILSGKNESQIIISTSLINFEADLSNNGIDFGGVYVFQGDDILGVALDIVGIFDPSGIADGCNVFLQIKNGNWADAGISAISLFPYLGDIAKTKKIKKDYAIYKITKESIESGKILKHLRQKAVREAWKQEQALVRRTGMGSRAWTKAEKQELLQNGKVKGYVGHHINNVKDHPELAGNPDNVSFIKADEHLKTHNGNFRNETHGQLINRK